MIQNKISNLKTGVKELAIIFLVFFNLNIKQVNNIYIAKLKKLSHITFIFEKMKSIENYFIMYS